MKMRNWSVELSRHREMTEVEMEREGVMETRSEVFLL